MTREEIGWLWLSLLPGVGGAGAFRLAKAFGGAEAAMDASFADVARLARFEPAQYDAGILDDTMDACVKMNARLVTPASEGYPERLAEIYGPPAVLYVLGGAELEHERALAIVGARKCTAYGREAALLLAEEMALAGVCVTSGLARGIDAHAHQGALNGGGVTLAVLGCGLDVAYPAENSALRERIIDEGGALVTEYPPGTPPLAHHFPVRNRLISALSHGVLVVEGTDSSGAAITASFAEEQGRETLAVPGNIVSPMSALPNRLIRDAAAHTVTCARDVLEALAWASPLRIPAPQRVEPALDEHERAVWACLVSGPVAFSQLCAATGFATPKLNSLLTTMELRGIIRQLPGRMVGLDGP